VVTGRTADVRVVDVCDRRVYGERGRGERPVPDIGDLAPYDGASVMGRAEATQVVGAVGVREVNVGWVDTVRQPARSAGSGGPLVGEDGDVGQRTTRSAAASARTMNRAARELLIRRRRRRSASSWGDPGQPLVSGRSTTDTAPAGG
jgi:hypothetical protein